MMEILGIQMLGILFALFMLYITFLYKRRNEFTVKESIFWFSAWIVLLILMIVPTSLDFFVQGVLNLGRRIDFFIIVGFIFLIGLTFYNYMHIKKMGNKVENLVRKIAIEKKR